MNVIDSKFVQGFIKLTTDGAKMNWHERNGGNLSYRIKKEEIDELKASFNYDSNFNDIGAFVPMLANEYFLVTGSGKYFSNIPLDPMSNIGIIQIDDKGGQYRIVWGLVNDAKPTSELPSHLMNHNVKKVVSNGVHRVIYHAHTTNIIALTFVLPLNDKMFTSKLWQMATECLVVFPQGVGVIPWMVPGGKKIAVATCKMMEKYDVAIWAHHGMFCSGEDFDLTFGLMHTVEKAAEILVKVLSMGGKKQTIVKQNFQDLAQAFNITLDENFL